MAVEGGTREIAADLVDRPAVFAVRLAAGVLEVADIQDVRIENPILGLVTRRLVGVVVGSFPTALVMLTAWCGSTGRPPRWRLRTSSSRSSRWPSGTSFPAAHRRFLGRRHASHAARRRSRAWIGRRPLAAYRATFLPGPRRRRMNKLATVGAERWHLPNHAHVIVARTSGGDELLTIYRCRAAQEPPVAQLTGNLVRVDADHETLQQPTGYIATLREPATLERLDETHWVIRSES